jgi:hypothetical protein
MADDEAVRNALDGLEMEVSEKASNIMRLGQNISSDISAIDNEIARLTKRKEALSNRERSLKEYLIHNMERTKTKRIECPLFSISHVDGKDVVEIESVKDLPGEYVTIKVEEKPDKRKLLNDLKAGKEIPSAKLVKSKSSLRIS